MEDALGVAVVVTGLILAAIYPTLFFWLCAALAVVLTIGSYIDDRRRR